MNHNTFSLLNCSDLAYLGGGLWLTQGAYSGAVIARGQTCGLEVTAWYERTTSVAIGQGY